jgi:arsenate reductase (glutaredoxin)
MKPVLYGIPNCDTMKKARLWLATHGIEYAFHDYKKAGIERGQLATWCQQLGFETLLNRRGTTWRGLSDAQKTDVDAAKAIDLMQQQPSLIKRPVLVAGQRLLVGFDQNEWKSLL